MSPKDLARLIAQTALAQLKVAVDQGVVLSVQTAEDIAVAIGGGAAQHISNLIEERAEADVPAVCTDSPEVLEALARLRQVQPTNPLLVLRAYQDRKR